MDSRLASFPQEVVSRFGFLVAEYGFSEPDSSAEGFVSYAAPPLWISVGLDERNKTVDTFVRFDDGQSWAGAPLFAILMTLGLPAQRARNSAQTRKGMIASLVKQAESLRELMPTIVGGVPEILE